MKNLAYLLPILALSLWSCEKELDYQIPDPGTKAVIAAQLNSGQGIEAFISRSVYSLSSQQPATADDFTALLYTDDPASPFELIPQNYNVGFEPQFVYRLAYDIEDSKTYRLVVTGPGIPEASVEEKVLDSIPFQNIRYNRDTKEFTFMVRDDVRTDDYYMITVNEFGGIDMPFSSVDLDLEFFEFDDFFGDGDTEGRQYGIKAFIKDDNFNGKYREFTVRAEGMSPAVFIELRFHHISESFYRYELTKSAYNYSDGFFSEPTQIFSNVDNGYGIMTSSSANVYKVQY